MITPPSMKELLTLHREAMDQHYRDQYFYNGLWWNLDQWDDFTRNEIIMMIGQMDVRYEIFSCSQCIRKNEDPLQGNTCALCYGKHHWKPCYHPYYQSVPLTTDPESPLKILMGGNDDLRPTSIQTMVNIKDVANHDEYEWTIDHVPFTPMAFPVVNDEMVRGRRYLFTPEAIELLQRYNHQ